MPLDPSDLLRTIYPQTKQDQPIAGRESEMVQNEAGGYGFIKPLLSQLRTFLILGTEGRTYYSTEQEINVRNLSIVKQIVDSGLVREAIHIINDVHRVIEGKPAAAPRKTASLVALAIIFYHGNTEARQAVERAIAQRYVISTPTQMFEWLHYLYLLNMTDGTVIRHNRLPMGKILRRIVADFLTHDIRKTAMWAFKYPSRTFKVGEKTSATYTLGDLVKMSHPYRVPGGPHALLFDYLKKGIIQDGNGGSDERNTIRKFLLNVTEAKQTEDANRLIELILAHDLTWEMIPSHWWKATNPRRLDVLRAVVVGDGTNRAFSGMPTMATIRNISRIASYGGLEDPKIRHHVIVDTLNNTKRLVDARIHPIHLLATKHVHAQGRNAYGTGWKPDGALLSALDIAFYASFGSLPKIAGRTLFAFDVSGSMSSGTVAGLEGMTANRAAVVMGMCGVRQSDHYDCLAFDTRYWPVTLTAPMSENEANAVITANGGGTDVSLPLVYAIHEHQKYDSIVIYTDNMSWAGDAHLSHLSQLIREYRGRVNPDMRLVLVGLTAVSSTLIDPHDEKTLEVVGFDATAPQVMTDFLNTR